MPIVRIDRGQMNYWTSKENPSGASEVVLFVHGAGGSQFVWSYQKTFFEKGFYPIILELPGHGESGGRGEDEIGRYANHVHAFLTALGLPKVFLVGHSMGGAIVQTLALAHPELIHGIVLAGTGVRLRVVPEILNGIRMTKEVEGIDLPTLVLCGEEDDLAPVKYSEFLRSRIPRSKLEVIPGAGHMVMMEAPGAFNEKVATFIHGEG